MNGETVIILTEMKKLFQEQDKKIDEKIKNEVNGLREEMNTRFEQTDEKIKNEVNGLREEMNARFEQTDEKINGLREEMNARFDEFSRDIASELTDIMKLFEKKQIVGYKKLNAKIFTLERRQDSMEEDVIQLKKKVG